MIALGACVQSMLRRKKPRVSHGLKLLRDSSSSAKHHQHDAVTDTQSEAGLVRMPPCILLNALHNSRGDMRALGSSKTEPSTA